MPHVIGSPCIEVKDTACVEVCPTDCIHAKSDSPQLYIDPVACIDCGACIPACPVSAIWPDDEVPAVEKKYIQINADFFKDFDLADSSVVQAREGKEKEAGESSAGDQVDSSADPTWTEVEGWEELWEAHRGEEMEEVEVRKRYGRVRTIFEGPEHFVLRFHLPEKMPIHPFRFRYGLPDEMCSYNVKADLKGSVLVVKGSMAEERIRRLSGHANSFPDGFCIDYKFDDAVKAVSVKKLNQHTVDVIVTKDLEAKAA